MILRNNKPAFEPLPSSPPRSDQSNPTHRLLAPQTPSPPLVKKKMARLALVALFIIASISTYSWPVDAEAPQKRDRISVVLLGSTGNLAKKYLWQGLYNIQKSGLPNQEQLFVYPCATKPFEKGNPILQSIFEGNISAGEAEKQSFLGGHVAPYTQLRSDDQWDGLKELLEASEKSEVGRVVYMSVPPSVFGSISAQVKRAVRSRSADGPWLRVIVEKPFGVDLASAEALSKELYANLDPSEIFLVDHYMGKQGLDAIREFRGQNVESLSKMLSKDKVQSVEVAMLETEDVKGRTSFYDSVGVVRDTMQNHLMMMYALLTMDITMAGSSGEDVARDEAVKALLPTNEGDFRINYFGQYADYNAHIIEDKKKWNEKLPEKPSTVPTFAHISLFSSADQWHKVPFVFMSGKALAARRAFTRVTFKSGDILLFNIQGTTNKVDGAAIYASDASFGDCPPGWHKADSDLIGTLCRPDVLSPNAYEVLLRSAFEERLEKFVRLPEVLASWTVWDPFLQDMEANGGAILQKYDPGLSFEPTVGADEKEL